MRTHTALAAIAALCSGQACTPRTAPPVTAGKTISQGVAAALSASPDGSRLAWLGGCAAAPGKGVACSLLVAPAGDAAAGGGAPLRVAEGVVPAAGSHAWNADGSLSALARRDPVSGAGELVVWRPGAEPRLLARRATLFTGGPGGEVAFVADGELLVAAPGGDPVRLPGGGGALAIAFAPAPARALAARVRGAGGSPVLLLWRGLAGEPAVVARDVGSFAFSPDGAWLAAVADVAPGTEGNLVAVPVSPPGGTASEPVTVARAVGPFQWAPGADRLAWLEGFDARVHAGRLSSARPGEAPVVHGERVTAFELAPGGDRLAYVRHVIEGGYAANLELSPSGAAAPATVTRDAAAFAFSPDGRFLHYRAGCAPSGDGCALFRVASAGTSREAERLADGVASFAAAPGRGERVIVAIVRRDGAGVDLSAWAGGRLVPLDGRVLPGSPLLLPPEGKRAAWIGTAPEHAGVFVADLP
jgi:hypothetical protein